MPATVKRAPADPLRGALQNALHEAEHLLPGQKPLEAFVHHNTLHSFEDQGFFQGVRHAGDLYGAHPWMSEREFRQAWAVGRIQRSDLDDALDSEFGLMEAPAPLQGRLADVLADLMLHQRPAPPAELHEWLLHEEGVLERLPDDMPRRSRERLARAGAAPELLRGLWSRAESLAGAGSAPPPVRLRDHLVLAGAHDPDSDVEPFLVRWLGAHLDHGTARWAMPDRHKGLLSAALRHWARGPVGRPWARGLSGRAGELLSRGTDAHTIILACLRRLGVRPEGVHEYVMATLLPIAGWAGMCVQLAARPDLAPGDSPPAALADVLALRLLLDEIAGLSAWRAIGAPPDGDWLHAVPAPIEPDRTVAAMRRWRAFTALVTLGVLPRELDAMPRPEARQFVALLVTWDEEERGRIWQQAYERRYRVEILDSLLAHNAGGRPSSPPPGAQVICCIDDREESFRRALEELSPRWQTFGYAGFYGLAMYFRALGEHRARPLCPPAIVPERVVIEELADPDEPGWGELTGRSALLARMVAGFSIGARTVLRGGLASLAGWSALIPLVSRTLFPRLHGSLAARSARPATRMTLLADGRIDEATGLPIGFTLEEGAEMVASALRTMGLTSGFAPLVVALGHGSRSLNNPHEAAHDCGACGGGRGGPNGRGFAWFANHPEVRFMLAERGIVIPPETHFIGGYHNTCDDALDLYDLELVPPALAEPLAELRADFERARALDAHERCRRFESAPLDLSPADALAHVEGRAEDLSQPRPEYGHATNALCFVGRRSWSRGLFLDRRVFLTSYDSRADAHGTVLQGLLAAVGPVGAGINLEYYFSFVDPARYGSGTKLPHNIAGLLGVMDGHSSDLRTGLPWQMVEIHEPVRLLNVIEGTPSDIDRALAGLPAVAQLVLNRWILVAAYDPESNKAWFLAPDGWVEHTPERTFLPRACSSLDWYSGHREHLPPASITSLPSRRTQEARHGA